MKKRRTRFAFAKKLDEVLTSVRGQGGLLCEGSSSSVHRSGTNGSSSYLDRDILKVDNMSFEYLY